MAPESGNDQEFYLEAIRHIVLAFREFIGEKAAFTIARRAPLEIDAEGEVVKYYGSGRTALELTADQYETFLGVVAVYKMQAALMPFKDQEEKIPPKIRPREARHHDMFKGLLERLSALFGKG